MRTRGLLLAVLAMPAALAGIPTGDARCTPPRSLPPLLQLPPLTFLYQPAPLALAHSGHSLVQHMHGLGALMIGTVRYELVQFHLHVPGERHPDGHLADMSLHLVHRDPRGRQAVVVILLDAGRDNPVLATFWPRLPEPGHRVADDRVRIDVSGLLPESTRYAARAIRTGADTMLWIVLDQPVPVSRSQLQMLRLHGIGTQAPPCSPADDPDLALE